MAAQTIPAGQSYPKMVTTVGLGGRTVPAVFPSGHAQQGTYVILANAAAEAAYTANQVGVPTTSSVSGGTGTSGTWENQHHG